MGWTLAIDYGTTSSAAAIANGAVALVEVAGAPRVPSVVMATEDGALLAGEVAVRQGAAAPDRVERTPKRRIGDRLVVLGEHQFAPVDLAAAVLSVLASEAVRQQGGEAPSEVRLTHPASWAGTRLGVLRQAAERAGLGAASFVPEPVAAALHYAGDRLAEGELVAVYDLGGGTFDTAVLRRHGDSFELVGPPGGSDRLGGEDFDERLYQHVGAALAAQDPEAWEQLRFSDERPWRRANTALRTEVRAAKEALSGTADYTIYVPAPVDREVRVTREELERLITPDIERTIDELVGTVARAGVGLADLSGVYLVGGSSRIPLVTRLLADRIGTVPVTWGDPKAVVVLGAAAAPASATTALAAPPAGVGDDTAVQSGVAVAAERPAAPDPTEVIDLTTTPPVPAGAEGAASPLAAEAAVAAASTPADAGPEPEPAAPPRRRVVPLAAMAAVVAVLALVGALFAMSGDDGGADDLRAGDGSSASSTSAASSSTSAPADDPVVTFDPEGDAELVATRTFSFTAGGDGFRSTTVLRNQTAGPITKVWFEVVPKELATRVADVSWSIAPTGVVVDDPVVWFEVALAAGDDVSIVWETALPDDAEPTQELLEEVATAHARALEAAGPAIYTKIQELAAQGAEVVTPEQPTVDDGGSDGGGTSGGSGGSGGTTGGTATGGTDGGTSGGSDGTTPPPPNGPPTISVSNQAHDERAAVNVTVAVNDPQGDPVTVTITGLPSGLSASGNRITGTISHTAVSRTARKDSIQSQAFAVTVAARDSKGAQSMKQFTWTVRDTHREMPNYVGKYGCGACEPGGLPDVADLANQQFACEATTNAAVHDTIAAQSVPAHSASAPSIIRWGQFVTFTYWKPSC